MVATTKLLTLATLPVLVTVVAWVPTAARSQPEKIAGRFTMTYAKREALGIPDAAGHMLLLTQAQGTNRNTGPTDFMAGADVTIWEIVDLIQGSGPNQGYVIQARGADSVFVKITGHVRTIASSQGAPSTSVEGSWRFVRGTGRYRGAVGTGTFKAGFVAPTEFTVDWQGDYAK